MITHYILDNNGQPVEVDLLTWARWFEKAERHVGDTTIGDASVSTVFLGTNHQWGDGPPLIWETLVFGGALDQEMERYSTREEALAGHAAMVERVRAAQKEQAEQ